jgi:hypothetical protein
MTPAFDYIKWLRGSLDNSQDGASGKKMAAFWVIMFVVTPLVLAWAIWAFWNDKWELLPEILDSLLFFAAAALAVNGAEKIIDRFKKPTNETNPPAPGSGNAGQ